jgi:hypothetical protein
VLKQEPLNRLLGTVLHCAIVCRLMRDFHPEDHYKYKERGNNELLVWIAWLNLNLD